MRFLLTHHSLPLIITTLNDKAQITLNIALKLKHIVQNKVLYGVNCAMTKKIDGQSLINYSKRVKLKNHLMDLNGFAQILVIGLIRANKALIRHLQVWLFRLLQINGLLNQEIRHRVELRLLRGSRRLVIEGLIRRVLKFIQDQFNQ